MIKQICALKLHKEYRKVYSPRNKEINKLYRELKKKCNQHLRRTMEI